MSDLKDDMQAWLDSKGLAYEPDTKLLNRSFIVSAVRCKYDEYRID